jgi:hypothetical protein
LDILLLLGSLIRAPAGQCLLRLHLGWPKGTGRSQVRKLFDRLIGNTHHLAGPGRADRRLGRFTRMNDLGLWSTTA